MQVRAHVEAQIGLIAAGKADKAAVVEHTLQQFVQKFLFFSENISRMDALFEVNFSPLTASGSPLLYSVCVHASYNVISGTSSSV
jgi:DNA topoisomerase III